MRLLQAAHTLGFLLLCLCPGGTGALQGALCSDVFSELAFVLNQSVPECFKIMGHQRTPSSAIRQGSEGGVGRSWMLLRCVSEVFSNRNVISIKMGEQVATAKRSAKNCCAAN